MLLKFPVNGDRLACPMCHKIPKWFYGFDVMDEGESLFELSIKCDCANASYTFSSSEIDSLNGKYDNLSRDLEDKVYREYRRIRDKIEDEKKKLLNKSIDELMQDNTDSITTPSGVRTIRFDPSRFNDTYITTTTTTPIIHDTWNTFTGCYGQSTRTCTVDDSVDVVPYLINTGVAHEVMDKIKDVIDDHKPKHWEVELYTDPGDLPRTVDKLSSSTVYYIENDHSINLVHNPDSIGNVAMYDRITDPAEIVKKFNIVDRDLGDSSDLKEGDIVLKEADSVHITCSDCFTLEHIENVSADDIRKLMTKPIVIDSLPELDS